MRWRHAATSIAVAMGLLAPAACLDAPRAQRLEIMGAPVVLDEFVPPQPKLLTAPDPGLSSVAPAPVPLTAQVPPDYAAAVAYVRSLPAQTLIRLVFADTPHVETMLRIARRESNFHCDAKNPRSSATGLFQTLSGWRGLTEQVGLSWENVRGPDCLDDVLLARAIYDRSGLGPWALTR